MSWFPLSSSSLSHLMMPPSCLLVSSSMDFRRLSGANPDLPWTLLRNSSVSPSTSILTSASSNLLSSTLTFPFSFLDAMLLSHSSNLWGEGEGRGRGGAATQRVNLKA